MKKWMIIGAGALFVLLLALAFVNPEPQQGWKRLPAYPRTVQQPGKYWINQADFIEVSKTGQGLEYREGHEEVVGESFGGSVLVTYSFTTESIQLLDGWGIGMEAPDTIVIELGNGTIIRRKHGDMHADPIGGHGVVIKKPKSPDGAVSSKGIPIPMEDIEVLEPENPEQK